MSVVGIDLGNRNAIIAVAQRGGIDIVLNETSNRQTPVVLGFYGNQRYIGEAGLTQLARNVRNTITHLKRLIGRKWQEQELQEELPYLPFRVVEGPNGSIRIRVDYNDNVVDFTTEELMGMMLTKLKQTAQRDLKTSNVKDVVISVPGFYTSAQRRAMLDAAQIAGLNPLRLMNEMTATALGYGIYKELPDTNPMHVMFVDMGDSQLSVSIVAFTKGKLKVIGAAYDRTLGGRNFDRALVEHFAKEFKDKFRVDVKTNMKALMRLEIACEKLKKILSANSQAPISVESLMDDVDCKGMMSREQFEKLCAPLFERIKVPIAKVMAETGITPDKLHSIELVGGASRMPQVARIVAEVTGKEHSRTLNAEESVARGCALQCAILSPVFKVREFKVEDCTFYPIDLVWKDIGGTSSGAGSTTNASPTAMDTEEPTQIFPKFAPIPGIKIVTFPKGKPFEIRANYSPSADLPPGTSSFIGQWTITDIPPTQSGDPAKIRVKVKLDLNSIFAVEYAQMVETIEVKEPPKTEAAPSSAEKKEEDTPAGGAATQNGSGSEASPASPSGAGAPASPSGGGTAPAESQPKTQTKRTNLAVKEVTDGMSAAEILTAAEAERRRVQQDIDVQLTAEAKNAVESYVYDTRNELSGELGEYVTESDRDKFLALLSDTENWLYEEGQSTTRQIYQEKLAALKKLGDPIQLRRREALYREEAVASLVKAIEEYTAAAQSQDPKYEHISAEEKGRVVAKCKEAHDAIIPKVNLQRSLPKTADPVVMTADIVHTKENLDRFCPPILNKPKPAPPKVEKKEPAQSQAQAQAQAQTQTPNGEKKEEDKPEPEPMATEEKEKKEAGPSAMDVGDD
jgi:heat shock protein 4